MKKRVKNVTFLLAGSLICLLTGCGNHTSCLPKELEKEEIKKDVIVTGPSLHDPQVIVAEDGTCYCYGSHMTAAVSEDLRKWKSFANGVTKANKIYDNLLEEPFEAFSFVGKNGEGGYSVWAPSVIYDKTTRKYLMYFCTTSSFIKSNIALATSEQIEGPYHYEKTILYSGFTKPDIAKTDFEEIMGGDKETRKRYVLSTGFNNQLWPNAIDPAAFYDEEDRMWMVYGSWSGGIFLLEIDPETGEPIHPQEDPATETDRYYGKRLIGGYHHPIEGPYIQYDADTGYYYLFLSYGNLQANGGYQIRVFRSDKVDGVYTDAAGQSLGIGGDLNAFADYGVKLMGNYTLPSLSVTYMAPGGQSVFYGKDGNLYIVYHQRYKQKGETHNVRVHRIVMNEDGWPCILPFATNGETLSETGYKQSDLTGTFYLLDHGLSVDAKVNEPAECTFKKGKIEGELTGSYEVEQGTNYITMKLGNAVYKGVMVEMTDEAGNDTFCISAVGENNHAIWGVHYLKKD
ncbi:MAG: glycoside hydrolase family 43 protein [Lachnospiraceae bacterium]|nr:glycoside hydrolase family 43 protein [Lachnospiraceae bacterium]